MRQTRIRTLATITALVSSISAPALAQRAPRTPHGHQPATPPVDPTVAQARAEFDQGRALLESQPAEALPHFQHAYELRPNPIVLLPIAQCQEHTGHIADAVATLQRYLHDRPDAPDHASVQTRIDELGRRPATLHIASNPAGAHVLLDGQDTSQTTPIDLPAPPGHHAVRIELAGHDPYAQELDATPGDRAEVTADLAVTPVATPVVTTTATTETPHPRVHHGVSPAVVVSSVIAVAGVASGTVFGLMALGNLSDYNRMPTTGARDSGEINALVSDISFGAAVLAAAVAVVVYVTDRSPDTSESQHARRTAPRLMATPGGLHLTF